MNYTILGVVLAFFAVCGGSCAHRCATEDTPHAWVSPEGRSLLITANHSRMTERFWLEGDTLNYERHRGPSHKSFSLDMSDDLWREVVDLCDRSRVWEWDASYEWAGGLGGSHVRFVVRDGERSVATLMNNLGPVELPDGSLDLSDGDLDLGLGGEFMHELRVLFDADFK